MAPEALPPDWQDRMVEMIRGAEPLDDAWFTGGPVCTPMDQIGIYRRQYTLRLYDALLEEIPGLHHLMGADGEALLRRYLAARPSSSWTLNRVADRLPTWLEGQSDVDQATIEMAWLDRCVQAGFEAADGEPLDPATLATLPALALQPHVSLLRVGHNVHELRSAILSGGDDGPELTTGDYPLVVFRRHLRMRHWVMPLGAWGVLDAIHQGATVPEALEQVFAAGWVSAEQLASEVQGWFREYAGRHLVMLRPTT